MTNEERLQWLAEEQQLVEETLRFYRHYIPKQDMTQYEVEKFTLGYLTALKNLLKKESESMIDERNAGKKNYGSDTEETKRTEEYRRDNNMKFS